MPFKFQGFTFKRHLTSSSRYFFELPIKVPIKVQKNIFLITVKTLQIFLLSESGKNFCYLHVWWNWVKKHNRWPTLASKPSCLEARGPSLLPHCQLSQPSPPLPTSCRTSFCTLIWRYYPPKATKEGGQDMILKVVHCT